MLRIVLAILVGAAAGVLALRAWEALGFAIWPFPQGAHPHSVEHSKSLMEWMPTPATAWSALRWGVGVFAGASIALLISQRRPLAGWIVAALVFALAAMTIARLPHLPWVMALSMAGAVAAAIAAQAMFGRKPA